MVCLSRLGNGLPSLFLVQPHERLSQTSFAELLLDSSSTDSYMRGPTFVCFSCHALGIICHTGKHITNIRIISWFSSCNIKQLIAQRMEVIRTLFYKQFLIFFCFLFLRFIYFYVLWCFACTYVCVRMSDLLKLHYTQL